MNITSNNGEIAGQVVMHSHIHFIPRWEGDGIKFFTRNNADQYDEKKYQESATGQGPVLTEGEEKAEFQALWPGLFARGSSRGALCLFAR